MTYELREILNKIEDLRQQLHELVKEKSLLDPDVLAASKKLDKKLNEYHQLLKKKERQGTKINSSQERNGTMSRK